MARKELALPVDEDLECDEPFPRGHEACPNNERRSPANARHILTDRAAVQRGRVPQTVCSPAKSERTVGQGKTAFGGCNVELPSFENLREKRGAESWAPRPSSSAPDGDSGQSAMDREQRRYGAVANASSGKTYG